VSGWKEWGIAEVVQAEDFQTYIQNQVVQVYASSGARGSALGTSVAEGMVSYLEDTNAVEVYNGSTWQGFAAGDITAVTAGTGLTGGGASGDVTLNVNLGAIFASPTFTGTATIAAGTVTGNLGVGGTVTLPTTTSIGSVSSTELGYLDGVTSSIQTQLNGMIPKSLVDAAGDLIYATADNTVARLAIGTAGQVLRVNSGATAPEWGAVSGGKIAQIVVGNLLTTATTTSTSFVDTGLSVTITPSSASNKVLIYATLPMGLAGAGAGGFLTLTDGSDNILLNPSSPGNRTISFTRMEAGRTFDMQTSAVVFEHSPGSTSAQTYKIRMRVTSGATICINRMGTDSNSADYSQGISTIVAFEVTP
jgi:hypothetical protein